MTNKDLSFHENDKLNFANKDRNESLEISSTGYGYENVSKDIEVGKSKQKQKKI
jgi:hypothetical protein